MQAERVTRLILVRHGESEGNRDRTFTQSPDVPLTPVGEEQALATAQRIASSYRASKVISSPYARAHKTAQIVAQHLGLQVLVDDSFREQSFGIFAGKPYDALVGDAAYHDGPRWRWRPPEGESLVDVYERAIPAFERLAQTVAGQDVVLVSHGGVMLTLCAFVAGSWDELSVTPNAGTVVVEYNQGKYRRCD